MIGNFCHPSLYSADRRANGGFARIIDYSKPVAKNALFPDARTHPTSPPLLVINESTENQLFNASESFSPPPPPKLAIKLINSLLQQNALYQPWKPLEELLRACKFRGIRKRKQSPFKFILKLGIFQKLWAVLASGDCRKEPNDSEEAITAAQRGSTMGISTGIVMTCSSGTGEDSAIVNIFE